tara:strand:+ start:1966 stop:2142 length:177 start_codon:yes stop_codon:yes gene_type:complete
MNDSQKKPRQQPKTGKSRSEREREARLAVALRDNLRRRKAKPQDSSKPVDHDNGDTET